jgi:tetratricopeptide (TPR) repeat protein
VRLQKSVDALKGRHVTLQLPTLSIFVSSTWHDLRPERRALVEALNQLRRLNFVGMEYSGAWDQPPIHPSLKEARECDAYVGIFGGRYGSGITAEEYYAARAAGRPCFVYLKNPAAASFEVDAEPEKREQQEAFKAELLLKHTCFTFNTPQELAGAVTSTLSNWYVREVSRRRSALHQLPSPLPDFIGRRGECETLLKALEPSAQSRVAGVCGMGGAGKTELALVAAEKLCDQYPDAQLFVRLHSMRREPLDLAEALKRCVSQLGVEGKLPDTLEELSKRYRSTLSGKRALVVLDDAADESQVRAFMPPRGCALLVTSREKLAVPGITNVRLSPLDAPEARELLTRIAPHTGADEAEEIASLCGHLPLALRAAGSFLSVTDDLVPASYVRQLRDEQTRLRALDRKAERMLEIGVEATFNISYERLGAEARRIFRQLAVFPGTFDRRAEGEVCEDRGGEHMSDLVSLSLVLFEERTGRYRLHDLVRLYAGEHLSAHERETGGRRHSEYYLETAREVEELHGREATSGRGLELFETEWENLRAGRAWVARHAASNDDAALSCLHYADALKHLIYLRRHPQEQAVWAESALAASRLLKQRVTEGRYLCHLGTAYSLTEPGRAVEYYRQALDIARETDDCLGEGNALGGLGNAHANLGRDEQAIECYEECLLLLYDLSDGRGAGRTLTNLGNIYAGRRQPRQAIEFYRRALEVAREIGDRRGEAVALCNLGDERVNSGESRSATSDYRQALSLMTEAADLRGQAAALTGLGKAHSALSEHARAVECFRQALAISREVGDPHCEGGALGGLGNEYVALRRFEEAVRCHEQALAISRRLGERRGEAEDLANIGHAHYMSGDARTALVFHFEALAASREIGSPAYEGVILWNIARALDKSGEAETARVYAADALEILTQLGHPLAQDARRFLMRDA